MVKRFCWRKRTEVGNLSILILSFSSVVSSNLPDVGGVASESQSEELLKCINMQMKWDIEYIVIIIMPIYVCVCTQLCLTLWDPVGYSSEGSSVHGVIPGRILEWVAISPSKGSSLPKIHPMSPAWQEDSLPLSHLGSPQWNIFQY